MIIIISVQFFSIAEILVYEFTVAAIHVHKIAAVLFAVTYVFFNKFITLRHASYKT